MNKYYNYGSGFGFSSELCCNVIRKSVDPLCRDEADTPIVRVYTKAF